MTAGNHKVDADFPDVVVPTARNAQIDAWGEVIYAKLGVIDRLVEEREEKVVSVLALPDGIVLDGRKVEEVVVVDGERMTYTVVLEAFEGETFDNRQVLHHMLSVVFSDEGHLWVVNGSPMTGVAVRGSDGSWGDDFGQLGSIMRAREAFRIITDACEFAKVTSEQVGAASDCGDC